MSTPDLFTWRDTYPHSPASRRTKTSKAAAKAMKPRAPRLRDKILALLQTGVELTPDEAAELMGASVLAIRPRFSELSRLGLIVETGEARKNASGHRAMVYRVGAYGERYEARSPR